MFRIPAPPPHPVPYEFDPPQARHLHATLLAIYLAVVFLFPRPQTVKPEGWRLLGLFAATIAGLVLQPIRGGALVLIAVGLASLIAGLSMATALAGFADPVVWGTGRKVDQPLYDCLWGSGFLPTAYQGVKFRSEGDPVLYLSNPPGIDSTGRRSMLDDIRQLNEINENSSATLKLSPASDSTKWRTVCKRPSPN